MNWFLIALIPPALWSITNHMDKFLISKYFKGGGVGALMVFSSLIGLLLLPFILIFNPHVFTIAPQNAFLIALNGFLYVAAILPYFYALNKDEASTVVPLFQMIPVLSYVLAFFILGETLSTKQILASTLVVVGAIGISLELSEGKRIRIKKDVLGYMFLSSFLFALNFIIFKHFALELSFWVSAFWEYVGFAIFAALLMIFVRSYRRQFVDVMKQNKITVVGLNGLNELINIGAKMSFNFASLLAPVTLIWVVNGTQPFFVFMYGVILTIFFPKLGVESLAKRHLTQKAVAIAVMFLGTYLINS